MFYKKAYALLLVACSKELNRRKHGKVKGLFKKSMPMHLALTIADKPAVLERQYAPFYIAENEFNYSDAVAAAKLACEVITWIAEKICPFVSRLPD